jgi:hypothetical protein
METITGFHHVGMVADDPVPSPSSTALMAGGVAPRTTMGVLGHSRISLTMNTFTHLSPAPERDAAQALEIVLGVVEKR